MHQWLLVSLIIHVSLQKSNYCYYLWLLENFDVNLLLWLFVQIVRRTWNGHPGILEVFHLFRRWTSSEWELKSSWPQKTNHGGVQKSKQVHFPPSVECIPQCTGIFFNYSVVVLLSQWNFPSHTSFRDLSQNIGPAALSRDRT